MHAKFGGTGSNLDRGGSDSRLFVLCLPDAILLHGLVAALCSSSASPAGSARPVENDWRRAFSDSEVRFRVLERDFECWRAIWNVGGRDFEC